MGNRDPRRSYGALVKFRLASLILLAVATLFYALPASNGIPIRVPLAIADRGPSGGDGVHDRPDNSVPGRRDRSGDDRSGASGKDAAADPRGSSSSDFHGMTVLALAPLGLLSAMPGTLGSQRSRPRATWKWLAMPYMGAAEQIPTKPRQQARQAEQR